MKEKETEVEAIDIDIVEVNEEKSDIVAHKEVTVSQLLKKNNELLAYHNNILRENKKIMTTNNIVNIIFRLILVAAAVVFCYFLYMIYNEIVLSNQKETTIVNNLPAQQAPTVNVSVPETSVSVNNQTVTDKISFYEGGFYGYVYKNTSKNLVFCKTTEQGTVYDIMISPNSTLELTPRIYSCKDAELVEIPDPTKNVIKNKPVFEL